MGLPKIPDAKEIAAMTAKAMEPMQRELEKTNGLLNQILAELKTQNRYRGVA